MYYNENVYRFKGACCGRCLSDVVLKQIGLFDNITWQIVFTTQTEPDFFKIIYWRLISNSDLI